ncbi:hypothetical protein [Pseudoponticoccus marisrubri]|uniref:Uncharacterized protein n=1 Tax=Pseudoponticoccus marisrubri TaxID=1685382 RepID=A0A0W7WF45_9RHOB|nr:hypothetical protein [Pseudoponticoccus marisrubri]KUF09102.1 hypothetical protein AVJ23_19455 [Pseudoponticoccus marisrubri]
MIRLAALIALLAAPAGAELPWSGFTPCFDNEVARFERALKRRRETFDAPEFDFASVAGVDYCGQIGITLCDDTVEDRIACQGALRDRLDALGARVLEGLPPPESVAGRDGVWSDGLYPVLWALAHGSSAGPDCAGTRPLLASLCEVRAANARLSDVMLLWQLARFLDMAESGVAAGWARPPPPTRPWARPAGLTEDID